MRNISLTKKINLLLLVALSVTIVVAFIQFKWANDSLIGKVRDKFETDAQILGQSVTTNLFERYYDVQAFSTNKVLTSKGTSKEEISSTLNALVNLYGVYDLIMYVDMKGNYLASSSIDSFGIDIDTSMLEGNYAGTSWFKKTLNGEFSQGKLFSGTFVEDPNFDPLTSKATGRQVYGTSFSTVVKNSQGEVVGVLTARANFKWIAKLFANFYQSVKQQNYVVHLSLIDGAGKVLFDYDPEMTKSEKFNYDETILGKLSVLDNPAVGQAIQGKKGSEYHFDKRRNTEVLVGYSAFDPAFFFEKTNWSILVQIPKDKALGNIINNEKNFLYGVVALFVFVQIFAVFITRFIGKAFIAESKKLSEASETSHHLSGILFETSDSVAAAAVEQSTGIQESVSALSEMASMISQTANNAKTSMESVQKVNSKAKEGENIMEEMMYSFRSIQEASLQLQRISDIIREITKKTTIINDIVLKTQLLSFNASIEAARAGQHGKGFAVVAEEVGNLAKVSGNAAKDIEQMLNDSQKQVQEILHGLHDRIEKSSTVSDQAVSNFKDISQEIEVIVAQIRGITDACAQQELGVQQTSSAMNQIDTATQKNSSTAQESLEAAKQLASENKKLKDISESLFRLINGKYHRAKKTEQDSEQGSKLSSPKGESSDMEDTVKLFLSKRSKSDKKRKAS
jgi:methyl-accepting chemotaxis protein